MGYFVLAGPYVLDLIERYEGIAAVISIFFTVVSGVIDRILTWKAAEKLRLHTRTKVLACVAAGALFLASYDLYREHKTQLAAFAAWPTMTQFTVVDTGRQWRSWDAQMRSVEIVYASDDTQHFREGLLDLFRRANAHSIVERRGSTERGARIVTSPPSPDSLTRIGDELENLLIRHDIRAQQEIDQSAPVGTVRVYLGKARK